VARDSAAGCRSRSTAWPGAYARTPSKQRPGRSPYHARRLPAVGVVGAVVSVSALAARYAALRPSPLTACPPRRCAPLAPSWRVRRGAVHHWHCYRHRRAGQPTRDDRLTTADAGCRLPLLIRRRVQTAKTGGTAGCTTGRPAPPSGDHPLQTGAPCRHRGMWDVRLSSADHGVTRPPFPVSRAVGDLGSSGRAHPCEM
jgi:hypothetical protein